MAKTKKEKKNLPPWLKKGKGKDKDKDEEKSEHDLSSTGDNPHGDESNKEPKEETYGSGKQKESSKDSGGKKSSHGGGGSALAMAKAGKLYPVLDSSHKGKKVKKSSKKGKGKKDMITLNLDSKQTKCDHEKVHPDISHAEYLNVIKKEKDDKDVKAESLNNVQQFIGNISQKNYAAANKYLRAALENKFKQQIASTNDNLGF